MQKLINKNLSFIDNTTHITLSLQNSWYKNWGIINRNKNKDYNLVPKQKSRLYDLKYFFMAMSIFKNLQSKTPTLARMLVLVK